MSTTELPILLSTRQAAELLNLSPRTLEHYRLRGGGPKYAKVGKQVRYRPEDLRAWIEERLYSHTTEETQKAS